MSTVEAVVSGLENGMAVVDVARTSGCGRCHEQGGCGGVMGGTSACATRQYRVPNTIQARVGDVVMLSVPEGVVLKAALASYGACVLLAIVGAALVTVAGGGDGVAVLGALSGLTLGLLLLRWNRRRWERATDVGLSIHFK
ncbi:SoxR reducing system RseC family protein [Denitratisoma oestradiolicum]|uniref:Positive regulator of sigma E activity n=1 Tax=Denitratisoma oestradiolicum TaxID=311182 RepID=A0A6S6XTN9_9PROT|nr:SoxR reducing system RseC family protein [Denitratisoma oestradiolicum]TWO80270.1 hypothetical protein CBW56_10690 [Denitratisoma oestradiolicum]CAB1369365.1 Positive regulator of sigma E activity [Denitratisoma oestradiolicum]